ncbi:MAG: glycerophosphodiester phosphodiesterase family protein [Christensenellales bacterium]
MKNTFLADTSVSKHFKDKFRAKVAFKIIGIVLACILGLLFLLICPAFTGSLPRVEAVTSYSGDNPYITFDERCLVSAHRAGGALAPENTLKAFETCLTTTEYKVDILEFDLHLTKDGELILLHDDTLNRTSDATEKFGSKKVYAKDKTLAEIKTLNMGENFTDENGNMPYKGLRGEDIPDDCKIITLNEVLDYTESVDNTLNYIIEIKDGGDTGRIATDKLYRIITERNMLERVVIGTFESEITKYMDEKYPDFIRSASIGEVLLTYYRFLFNVNLDDCDVKFEVLQIPVIPLFDMSQKSFIDYCHHYGLALQYWTINEYDTVVKLVNNGADAIITDNPKTAYNAISALKK